MNSQEYDKVVQIISGLLKDGTPVIGCDYK